MGTYYEYRAPQGAPADGEKGVWLVDGEVRFGHYVAASDTWIIDKVINADVDTPAPDYETDALATEDWHYADPNVEYGNWESNNPINKLRYRLLTGGGVEIRGQSLKTGLGNYIMTLGSGYRPSAQRVIAASNKCIRWDGYAKAWVNTEITINTDGTIVPTSCNVQADDTIIFQGFVYSL